MLEFSAVQNQTGTIQEVAAGLTKADLEAATHAFLDDVLARMAHATDADITFVPVDPAANDVYAVDPAEVEMAWTLGHVVVHLTASAEEAAFIAAELARGVAREGRSRREVPWPLITSAAAARSRIEESRRMMLATLAAWPDSPLLKVTLDGPYGPRNAIARFLSGLNHLDTHRDHVSQILGQARAARAGSDPTP